MASATVPSVPQPSSHDASNSIHSHRSSQTRYELDSIQPSQTARPPGYPGLSKFLNTEDDLLVFRRFGALGVRNILYRQDVLAEMEEQLEECDAEPHPSDTRRFDQNERRRVLMDKIHEALVQYEEAVRIHADLLAHSRPTERQRENLKNYFQDWCPLVLEEDRYILSDLPIEEFISLGGTESSILKAMESNRYIQRLFRSKKERPGAPPNSNVEYYSIKAIKRTYRGMMLLGSWIFLVIPICLLYRSNNNVFKLVTVVAFLVTFSISVAVLTKAKDWEMLASTAAYAAVLVVFLQIEST